MSILRERIRELADGSRTAVEIAAAVGIGDQWVRKICRQEGLIFRTPDRKPSEKRARHLSILREMAPTGVGSKVIGQAMGLHWRTVQNMANREGIKIARPQVYAKPKAEPVAPVKVQTVEEWLRVNRPRKFEPGTLDQILADTLASAGKRLAHTAGQGASWTPYTLDGKRMSRAQVVAAANKIRERQGKPLLSEPRRKAA